MNRLKFKKMKNQMNLMSNKLKVIALMGMVMLLGSCGESVDPTTSNINLEMRATTELSTINANARVASTGIEFTKVLIGVTEIELKLMDGDSDMENDDSGNDDSDSDHSNDDSDDKSYDHKDRSDKHNSDENEIEFEGQFVVDLLNGTSNPEFGITDIEPGIYKELEVKISPIMDDGNSIFIQLIYQPNGMDSVIVEYSSNKEIKFEIENHSGMQFDGNAINQILVLFDLDELFAGVDLSMANKDSDGVIRINNNSNSDLATTLWQNIDDAFDAGEDHDRDQKIDHDTDDDHAKDKHSDDD